MKVEVNRNMDLLTFILSWISVVSYPGVDSGAAEVQNHLEMGRIHLENRQFSDALTHFHAAVEGDPNNYQTYFRRALVFMALGKYNQALKDFSKVIEIKSDFSAAVLQRASLLFKQGQLDLAHIDYENVLRKEPNNAEATAGYELVEAARKDYEEAKYYSDIEDCNTAVELLTRLIENCPWDPSLRKMRSDCYLSLGDASRAVSDLRFGTKLVMDDTDGLYRLSSIQYQLGEIEDSLREIRECLKLDPEHKFCMPLYKKIKKIDKHRADSEKNGESSKFTECVDDIKKALKADKQMPQMVEWKLRSKSCWCHLKGGDGSHAVDECTRALKIREDIEILMNRAESYLLNDLFNDAMDDYKRCMEIDEDNRQCRDGLQKAQKLQKQASKRDYYKILGVKKTASKQEIVKAYRKAAQKWHPDNFQQDPEAKKAAEAKFIDIAAAKEVLTDPEKRAKFDQGEDPLDHEQQSHQHGFNPFQHFHFQNSGPFHFRFQ